MHRLNNILKIISVAVKVCLNLPPWKNKPLHEKTNNLHMQKQRCMISCAVTVQAGLCWTWSETKKNAGFLL